MTDDIFKAGVAPGGPTSQSEVKMLICYLLSRLEGAVGFSILHGAMAEHSLVNYFELVAAVDELLQTGHLTLEEGSSPERYLLTATGKEAARQFTATLPASVREKALEAAKLLLARQRRLSEVSVREEAVGKGFILHLSIPEEGGSLIAFSVFAPNTEQRDLIRRRFLNAPLTIYSGVMGLLTGDPSILEALSSPQEPLF